MSNNSFLNPKLKILASGDPNTQIHSLSPEDILNHLGPPRQLLSTSSKVNKGLSKGVLSRVLYLTPGAFCPAATLACRSACLGHTSGRMGFPSHAAVRDRRSALYLADEALFMKRLRAELIELEAHAEYFNLTPAVRLNGTSDILWERRHPELFAEFQSIQFYDYTKIATRVLDFLECTFPSNYHLTFSTDAQNVPHSLDLLRRGASIAVVFWPILPKTWWDFPVVDGDLHDARFLDDTSIIIGLRAKGLARVDTDGLTFRPCLFCESAAPPMSLVSVKEDTHRLTLHECSKCNLQYDYRWKLPVPCAESQIVKIKGAA